MISLAESYVIGRPTSTVTVSHLLGVQESAEVFASMVAGAEPNI